MGSVVIAHLRSVSQAELDFRIIGIRQVYSALNLAIVIAKEMGLIVDPYFGEAREDYSAGIVDVSFIATGEKVGNRSFQGQKLKAIALISNA